jgi:methylenetetrahydrofolate reductase (NADPH)
LQGFENLTARIKRLSRLNPLGISVTWGANGASKDRSLDLAGLTQSELGIDTLLHLTCTNMEKGMVDEALKVYSIIYVAISLIHCFRQQRTGGLRVSWPCEEVRTFLLYPRICRSCLDPPRGEEYWMASDPQFLHAVDLISYIRKSEFSSQFCIGVAGQG